MNVGWEVGLDRINQVRLSQCTNMKGFDTPLKFPVWASRNRSNGISVSHQIKLHLPLSTPFHFYTSTTVLKWAENFVYSIRRPTQWAGIQRCFDKLYQLSLLVFTWKCNWFICAATKFHLRNNILSQIACLRANTRRVNEWHFTWRN